MNSPKKYNTYFILSAVFIVSLITILVLNNGKGTYSAANDPTVSIDCPEVVNANSQVTCDIRITIPNGTTVSSVNANYDMPTGLINGDITFTEDTTCNSSSCFQKFVSTNNGFSVINQTGTTNVTNFKIGTITFTINGADKHGQNVTLGLKNIELCAKVNNEYVMINPAATTASQNVRIKNNLAALNSLSLAGVISENFSSANHKYTATIADNYGSILKSNWTISLSEYATLTGLDAPLNPNYGTNTYTATVHSEDGSVNTNYTVEIKREFNFSLTGNSAYVYNKNDNYIFINDDAINNFIPNLPTLPTGLSYRVNGNKLEIYVTGSNEVLNSINIVNLTQTYPIIGQNMYIDNNVTLGQVKNYITGTNITVKVFNGNNEITNNSTIIQNNNTLKIYYNSSELDSYTIKLEYLDFDSTLAVDDNNNIIKRLAIGTTFGQLKQKISTSGTISLETTGATVTDNYELRTGDVIRIALNDSTQTYTLSVLGCLDSNVNVSLADVIVVYRASRKRIILNNEQAAAADITGDGNIKLDDVIIIYRFHRKKINSLEVG